jgi:mRNA-degrading endonuclease RelE of RelBE toxin-antitoxin system
MEEKELYTVEVNKRTLKTLRDMPKREQILFKDLVRDLSTSGAIRKDWPNFSPLAGKKNKYHCHLSYHWVACWEWKEGSIIIEVYYAGSREKAPY